MARVRPFSAWRYASPDIDISALVAPPYDVISDEERSALASRHPHNTVLLELPEGPLDPSVPGNRYETGALTWRHWRDEGILVRDAEPRIYILEQRFSLEGSTRTRRALIAEVGLEPFEAGVVLPHERTLPKALGDRFELIKSTAANLSQVFGLFEDAEGVSDAWFRAVMATPPIARATDRDGVTSVLWSTNDPALMAGVAAFMADRPIFIADGHHRYTTALAYRDLMRERVGDADTAEGEHAYDHVMMALVNMDDPDLAVLPYNRIVDAPTPFDADGFERGLSEHFDVTEHPAPEAHAALAAAIRPAFLFRTRDDRPDTVRLAQLAPRVDVVKAIDLPHSPEWKRLDVAILQELVLWPLLGVHPDKPETLERISFTKDADVALAAAGEHDVAFVLRPTALAQLRAVSLAGETMPQKSTYFYPKLLSGLLFRSAE
jgi:uncharacterized protein (DUF1015 family)